MKLLNVVDEVWNQNTERFNNGTAIKIGEDGKDYKQDYKDFREAFFATEDRQQAFTGALMDIGEKSAIMGILKISGGTSLQEALGVATSSALSKPLMALMYLGYLIGKKEQTMVSEADMLQTMFEMQIKGDKNVSSDN